MDARLIAVASPIFFVLIFLERALLRRRAEPVYRLHDSIAALSCGVGEQILQVFTFVLELALYSFVFTRFRLYTWSMTSVLGWVLLVLALDVAYYWFHRASHRVNFLWAVHGVHHQSEEYNLSVALRQGWIEPLMIAPFHIPLALAGFPPEMFFIGFTAHTLWQFWPHTRGIGKLRVDGLFNTPSNHRCHHAVNPAYIDKNYSGFLIVWDRLFGTWAREHEEPVYGTVKPLASWNPLWANLSYWTEIGARMKETPGLFAKLSVPFRPPEWRHDGDVVIPEASRATQQRYEVKPPRSATAYALVTFAVILLGQPALTQRPDLPLVTKLIAAAFAILGLVTVAGVIEQRRWLVPVELMRLVLFPCAAYLLAAAHLHQQTITITAAAFSAAQAVWLLVLQRRR